IPQLLLLTVAAVYDRRFFGDPGWESVVGLRLKPSGIGPRYSGGRFLRNETIGLYDEEKVQWPRRVNGQRRRSRICNLMISKLNYCIRSISQFICSTIPVHFMDMRYVLNGG